MRAQEVATQHLAIQNLDAAYNQWLKTADEDTEGYIKKLREVNEMFKKELHTLCEGRVKVRLRYFKPLMGTNAFICQKMLENYNRMKNDLTTFTEASKTLEAIKESAAAQQAFARVYHALYTLYCTTPVTTYPIITHDIAINSLICTIAPPSAMVSNFGPSSVPPSAVTSSAEPTNQSTSSAAAPTPTPVQSSAPVVMPANVSAQGVTTRRAVGYISKKEKP